MPEHREDEIVTETRKAITHGGIYSASRIRAVIRYFDASLATRTQERDEALRDVENLRAALKASEIEVGAMRHMLAEP